jgi:uncharacterized membrane protein YpjA
MNLTNFVLLALSILVVIPTSYAYFLEFRKRWFKYAWSVHALLFGIISLALSTFNLSSNILNSLAATTLIFTGFGMISIILIFAAENKYIMGSSLFMKIGVPISHLFMGFLGVYFITKAHINVQQLIIAWCILAIYLISMSNRFNVPWILYKPSRLSLKVRKGLIWTIVLLISLLAPLTSYLRG